MIVSCQEQLDTTPPPEFAPGISYTNYRSAKPWSAHVVRLSRKRDDFEFRSIHARNEALGISTLSRLLKDLKSSSLTPVVAINGDFYQREKEFFGDPRGLQIMNGELLSAPSGGVSFWLGADGRPQATNVFSNFTITWPNGLVTPFGLNQDRRSNSWMVLYTPAAGASTKTKRGRELILEPHGATPWLPLQAGQIYAARIRQINEHGDTCFSPNIMILSLKPSVTNILPVLAAGDVLMISTETLPDLRGVQTAMGGGPLLLVDGQRQHWPIPNMMDDSTPFSVRSMWERHPRSAIGWNDDWFFLVEVDGRLKKVSLGFTLNELADYLLRLGCRQAMNLDGGGSSMFWCQNRIVNDPSDKKERRIANALVVLRKTPGPDPPRAAAVLEKNFSSQKRKIVE